MHPELAFENHAEGLIGNRARLQMLKRGKLLSEQFRQFLPPYDFDDLHHLATNGGGGNQWQDFFTLQAKLQIVQDVFHV